ncbi:Serine/threonine-protein phosphatase 7 long form homolog [Linum perenne]
MPSYNEAYKPHLERVGLYGVHLFLEMRVDHDLITALVERWRLETHTFHMPEGECTLSLQDVNIISGLRIDGGVVTSWTASNSWIKMIADFLGPRLKAGSAHMKGSQLKLTWLTQTFNELPPHPTPLDIERYARAYMLCLIGGFLFPNKSTRYVHLMWLPLLANFNNAATLSWGLACLAWLYRELCRASHVVSEQLSGAYFIIQIWAWEHFPIISRTPVDHVSWDDDEYIDLPYGMRYVLYMKSFLVSVH